MKKLAAALLIAFFTLAIINAPRGAQLNPPKDLGGTVVLDANIGDGQEYGFQFLLP